MVALCVAALTGCSADALESLAGAAGDAYDKYGRPAVSMREGDGFYGWRYDFRHECWAGEPCLDLGPEAALGLDLDGGSGLELDSRGRVSVSYGAVADAALIFVPDLGPGLPEGLCQAEHPGICPGGFLYRAVGLPGGGAIACTAYLAEQLGSVKDSIDRWLESYPGEAATVWCRAFYANGNKTPEGVLVAVFGPDGMPLSCHYFWNVQPGIGIDYSDGRSWVEAAGDPELESEPEPETKGAAGPLESSAGDVRGGLGPE